MDILLVEDDDLLANAVRKALERMGCSVVAVVDGSSAQTRLREQTYDAVVLDLGLPYVDGETVLSELRSSGNTTPVLILSARDSMDDRIRGLDLGADDYLIKPFGLQELEARIKAIIRRHNSHSQADLCSGSLRLDVSRQQVFHCEKLIEVPTREFQLLQLLFLNVGELVSKQQIAEWLTSCGEETSPKAAEVYVHRLRKKLEDIPFPLRTIRGIGYLLELSE